MDLSIVLNWETLVIPIITTMVFISALTLIFDKFFLPSWRKKLLTLAVALVVTVVTVEFSMVEWQSTIAGWLLTFGLSVLVYQYLGVEWLKKYIENKLK